VDEGTCVIKPIRQLSTSGNKVLVYNTGSGEITANTNAAKTFVIDHPTDSNKYLVHACLEGPETGVYYRGTGIIPSTKNYVEITLPDYVEALAREFTVHVTPIIDINDNGCDANDFIIPNLASTRVKKGKFRVYMSSTKETNNKEISNYSYSFDYVVFAKRGSLDVEPKKTDVTVKGNGPYTWL
jgi:hypothetical protein